MILQKIKFKKYNILKFHLKTISNDVLNNRKIYFNTIPTYFSKKIIKKKNVSNIFHDTIHHMNLKYSINTFVPDYSGFEIIFLGTGAGGPSILRNSSSIVVRFMNETWLFDCGEGTLRQCMMSTIRFPSINKIFITHLHGDHIYGLFGMLCSLDASYNNNIKDGNNIKRIDIYGPYGIYQFIINGLVSTYTKLSNIEIYIHEITNESMIRTYSNYKKNINNDIPTYGNIKRKYIFPSNSIKDEEVYNIIIKEKNSIYNNINYTIQCSYLSHTIPSIGYVIKEQDYPGKIDKEIAISKGIYPGPKYKDLKNGIPILNDKGIMIQPNEIIGSTIKGRKVVILGDTCNSIPISFIGMNPDVLIHEATLPHHCTEQAINRGHSSSSMAGYYAKLLNAKLLILTHLSQKFSQSSSPKILSNIHLNNQKISFCLEKHRKEAMHVFKRRSVMVAEDFMRIRIPRNK